MRRGLTGTATSAMYATCLHCNAPLGQNAVIEHFPVGRRLAFDAVKGRLWVVCLRCRRWNLTPTEERWEAIEDCERLFGGTRLRTSTDNIGLARVGDRVDLIRIGVPRRPEMAAWRYGDELRRRWKKHGIPSLLLTVPNLGTASLAASTFYVAASGSGWGTVGMVSSMTVTLLMRRVVNRDLDARVVLPDGQVTNVRALTLGGVTMRLVADRADQWSLRLMQGKETHVAGETAASRTLRGILAYRNAAGGRGRDVTAAVDRLQRSTDARAFIMRTIHAGERTGLNALGSYPAEALIALEMALHDETERRALEGELEALAAEWALAEEVAKVADDMFLPDAVRARYDALTSAAAEGSP